MNERGASPLVAKISDGFVSGLTRSYPDTIRPALEVIGTRPGTSRVAGAYLLPLLEAVGLSLSDVARDLGL